MASLKNIILFTAVGGAIGYYLYQKSRSVAPLASLPPGVPGPVQNGTVTPQTGSTGSTLDDFYNDIFNAGNTNAQQTGTGTTTTTIVPGVNAGIGVLNPDTGTCAPPVLRTVSHNAANEIVVEWDVNASNYNSIKLEYSKNNKDWTAKAISPVSPANMGSVTVYNQGSTLKFNSKLYIRLTGNCRNGKVSGLSNVLTYNLVYNTGSDK